MQVKQQLFNNDYIYRAYAWSVCCHKVLFAVRKLHMADIIFEFR